ncbi:hypothetical protein HDU99_009141, partial [Rhizoclosmatium hyalinum]
MSAFESALTAKNWLDQWNPTKIAHVSLVAFGYLDILYLFLAIGQKLVHGSYPEAKWTKTST